MEERKLEIIHFILVVGHKKWLITRGKYDTPIKRIVRYFSTYSDNTDDFRDLDSKLRKSFEAFEIYFNSFSVRNIELKITPVYDINQSNIEDIIKRAKKEISELNKYFSYDLVNGYIYPKDSYRGYLSIRMEPYSSQFKKLLFKSYITDVFEDTLKTNYSTKPSVNILMVTHNGLDLDQIFTSKFIEDTIYNIYDENYKELIDLNIEHRDFPADIGYDPEDSDDLFDYTIVYDIKLSDHGYKNLDPRFCVWIDHHVRGINLNMGNSLTTLKDSMGFEEIPVQLSNVIDNKKHINLFIPTNYTLKFIFSKDIRSSILLNLAKKNKLLDIVDYDLLRKNKKIIFRYYEKKCRALCKFFMDEVIEGGYISVGGPYIDIDTVNKIFNQKPLMNHSLKPKDFKFWLIVSNSGSVHLLLSKKYFSLKEILESEWYSKIVKSGDQLIYNKNSYYSVTIRSRRSRITNITEFMAEIKKMLSKKFSLEKYPKNFNIKSMFYNIVMTTSESDSIHLIRKMKDQDIDLLKDALVFHYSYFVFILVKDLDKNTKIHDIFKDSNYDYKFGLVSS